MCLKAAFVWQCTHSRHVEDLEDDEDDGDDDDCNVVLFGSVNIAAESSFYANDPCGLGVCLPDGASNVFFNAKYHEDKRIYMNCAAHAKVTTTPPPSPPPRPPP